MYVRKLQIKTMRYYTLVRKAKIHNLDDIKCWWDYEATGTLYSLLVEMQNDTATLEDIFLFLPYDLATVLLVIYPSALKTYAHKKTCTWMFTTLFIIAQNRKQPRYPSMGE